MADELYRDGATRFASAIKQQKLANPRRCLFGAESTVGLLGHPCGNHFLEASVVHEPDEDLLVLVHAIDEQLLEHVSEEELEFVARVDRSGASKAVVGRGRLDDLVEEQLIGLVEVRTETLVDDVDQLRELHGLLAQRAAADLSGALELAGLTVLQGDRTLTDFLQPVVLKPYFVIKLISGATRALRQFGREMTRKHVEALEIRILVRNYLAQETV